jgi:hypothetical protein
MAAKWGPNILLFMSNRILSMAAKWGPNVLLFMSNRILCMAAKWGPNVLLFMSNRILCMAAKWGPNVLLHTPNSTKCILSFRDVCPSKAQHRGGDADDRLSARAQTWKHAEQPASIDLDTGGSLQPTGIDLDGRSPPSGQK